MNMIKNLTVGLFIGLGGILKGIGCLIYMIFGLWALFVNYSIVIKVGGFWAFVIAIPFLPLTLFAAPLYALLAWGNPMPMLITFVPGIIGSVLMYVGSRILGEE